MAELISGSQLDAWNRCQRLYHYAHDRRIAPIETSWPLALGRAGHSVLAAYYSTLQLGATHAEAVEEAEGNAAWRAEVLGQDQKALGYVMPRVRSYLAAYLADASRWQVLEVEREYRVERAGWTYIMTIDLVVAPSAGGQLVAVDHRFLMSFYTVAMARHDPQLPRYALAIEQATGSPVPTAVRNMISTHPNAMTSANQAARTKRVPVDLTPRRLEIVNIATERTAQEILAWRQLPMSSRAQLARRTEIPGDRYPSCQTCEFFTLCTAEGWGEDATDLEAREYGPSDYGGWT